MDKEYIEREALIKDFELMASVQPEYKQSTILGMVSTIKNRKAADVAPVVNGEWINIPAYIGADGKLHKAQECSVCKVFFVSDPNKPYSNHPYCAECGAKMDGGGHGD